MQTVTLLGPVLALAVFAWACNPILATDVPDRLDASNDIDASAAASASNGTDASVADSASNSAPLRCVSTGLEFKLVGKERFCFDGCDHPVALTRVGVGAVSVATGPCDALCGTACVQPDMRGCGFQCGPGLFDFGTNERRWSWDGTVFVDGRCDAHSCRQSECAPPGRYRAKVCGAYGDEVAADNFPDACKPRRTECVEVEFVWPSSTPIVLAMT